MDSNHNDASPSRILNDGYPSKMLNHRFPQTICQKCHYSVPEIPITAPLKPTIGAKDATTKELARKKIKREKYFKPRDNGN